MPIALRTVDSTSTNAVSLFICTDDKTLSVAMCVRNPDGSSFKVESRNPA